MDEFTQVDAILDRYASHPGSLVRILHEVQKEYHHIPKEALLRISLRRKIPLSRLYSVANFYTAFSLKPRGRHEVCVCMGTACHVRGAPVVLEEIERRIGLRAGETSSDLEYTLETVRCLGACAMGPIVVVDGKYHGNVSPDQVGGLLGRKRGTPSGQRKKQKE